MAQKKQQTMASYCIKLLICLLFMFAFRYIPGWHGITPNGMSAIGIFIGLVLMIVFNFGLIQATCLAIFAVVSTGFYTGSTVIGQTIGNNTVVQMFFIFAVCNSLIQTGAGEFIAKWLLSRKWIQGKPVLFCSMLLFVGWLCGPFMGTAGLILLYNILDYVDDTLGIEHSDSFSMMIRLGCQTMCMLGMAFLPFKGIALAIFNTINNAVKEAGYECNYALYMIASFCIALIFAIGFLFLMLKVFKDNVSPLRDLDITKMEGMQNIRSTKPQRISMIITLITILYTLVSLILGTKSAFGKWFGDISLWVWGALMLSIIGLLKADGKPVVSTDALMSKIQWGITLATAAFTVVGGMISNPELGVRTWINDALKPIFEGMSFPVFLLVVVLASSIITNFFSNMATGLIIGSLIVGFSITYCQNLSVDPTFIALALVQGSFFAYLTMAAAGPAPLLLAQPAYVNNPGFIWKRGIPVLIWGMICNWGICLLFSFIA